jgi:hypothetical protein
MTGSARSRLHCQHRAVGSFLQRGYGVAVQRPEFHPLDCAQIGYESIGLAKVAIGTVSPFSLILNIVLSGVLEFGAFSCPSPKRKVGGRYGTDLLMQLPALLVRFRRISELVNKSLIRCLLS